MTRILVPVLVAVACIGATGGTLAATSTDQAPESRLESSDPADVGDTSDVFWANQRVLHDGATTVRIDLPTRPVSLERAVGGWVVTTLPSPDPSRHEVYRITPDGTAVLLAVVDGDGDVSPDGTRYVALADTGSYQVYDVASGQSTGVVAVTDSPVRSPIGGAQFVDDDTVAATFTDDRGRDEVRAVPVAGGRSRTLARDVIGEWSVSPDGRWLARTNLGAIDAMATNPDCSDVLDLRHPVADATDCRATYGDAVPSWSSDSRTVLALPGDTEGFGPSALRRLSAGDAPLLGDVAVPEATLGGVYLDDRRIVLLGADDTSGDGTRISVCEADGLCAVVATTGDAAGTAVLGTTT